MTSPTGGLGITPPPDARFCDYPQTTNYVRSEMSDTADTLRAAAIEVLRATDAQRDAINGRGHPGEDHDTMLGAPRDPRAAVQIYDTVGDCALCGGTQYGTEDDLHRAIGDLREALGHPRLPWEVR